MDVLEDSRGVLSRQGVVDGEGKRGPSGDGTWFVFGGDLGMIFVGRGCSSMTFTQLHLDGVQDTGADVVVISETDGEGKGMAAGKCVGSTRGDKGGLDVLLVIVCLCWAILGGRGIGLSDGTARTLERRRGESRASKSI